MNIDYLAVVFRWLHILPAIIAVGGTVFMRMALLPSIGELPEGQRAAFHEAIRSRWAKWVMGSIAFLLVSGFYNFFSLNARLDLQKPYHMLFGIKFLLALAIFAIASFLAGRTAVAQRMRKNARMWLNLNITLAVTLVCLSGVMRSISMKSPQKAASSPASATAAEPARP